VHPSQQTTVEIIERFIRPCVDVHLIHHNHTLLSHTHTHKMNETTPSDLEIKAQAIAAVNEPPAKRAKTGWDGLALNINDALASEARGCYFSSLVESDITALNDVSSELVEFINKELECTTLAQLATYKFYRMAKMIATLADYEVDKARPKNSVMNLDNALLHEYETMSLKDILGAPVCALQGIGETVAEAFDKMDIKTVRDLGTWKLCRVAEAIVEAAKYEEILTEKERKVERELKKLV
jgi:hypothetical protein